MPGLPYKDGDESEELTPTLTEEERATERLALLNRYSEVTKDILMEKGLIGSIQGEIFVFGSLGFQICIIDAHNDVPQDILMFICPVSTGFPPVLLEKEDFEYENIYEDLYSFNAQYHEGVVSPHTQHFTGEFNNRGNITAMKATDGKNC